MQNKLKARSRTQARTSVVQIAGQDDLPRSNRIGLVQQRLAVTDGQLQQDYLRSNFDTSAHLSPSGFGSRNLRLYISFFLLVLIPTIVAGIYYFGVASKQYVAEFKFSVKDNSPNVASGSGLSAFLGSAGGTGAENYMVTDYLT